MVNHLPLWSLAGAGGLPSMRRMVITGSTRLQGAHQGEGMQAEVRLSEQDCRACIEAVARCVQARVQPGWARPERTMPQAECRQALAHLEALGLLDDTLGLWAWPEAPQGRQLSLACLAQVAGVSGALALQLHTEALARHLDRLAGLGEANGPDGAPGRTLVVLQGHLGLGREAVAALCSGQALSDEHAAMLADNWAWPQADTPRPLHALPDWTALWCPTWTLAEGWVWHRLARAALQVTAQGRGLGLDELSVQQVWVAPGLAPGQAGATATLRGPVASQAWGHLQALQALGLWAIAQAGAQRAAAMAHEQAHLRRQGGAMIAQHAAVQQLLSLAQGSAREAATDLQRQAHAPDVLMPAGLRELWRARARHQQRLSQGASAALQVFGGMGYMQDTGLERWLRQTHHLRLLGGSPAELQACVAWWDTWADADLEACA